MRLLSFLFTLLILFAVSCGNPIEKVLSDREEALETKNVDLYMSLISPSYSLEKDNKVIGVEEVRKNFLSNVTLFDNLEISHTDRSIYDKGQKTEVVQMVVVVATVNEYKSRFRINERIELAKIDGKWRIVKESDADFLERFVFGGSN
jgi:hypothetical protein